MKKQDKELGKKYNHLTIIRRATEEEYPRGSGMHIMYLCKCDCGNFTFAQGSQLRSGKRVSCGCSSREKAVKLAKVLGEKNRPDLLGKKFGQLTVIKLQQKNPTKWLCRCSCGGFTIVNTANLKNGHTTSCGCRAGNKNISSKGEELIINILNKNKINFIKEKTFEDLLGKNKIPLRFDFAIYNNNNELQYLIEYQGEQHYKQIKVFSPTKQDFLKRQEYDRKKASYCLAHKIKLYAIPFFEIENIKELKDLTQEKFLVKSHWHNDRVYKEYLKDNDKIKVPKS